MGKSTSTKTDKINNRWWMKWSKIALYITITTGWTVLSVLLSQLIVARIMAWLIGSVAPELLQKTVVKLIYVALSFVLAAALVILVPPRIAINWKVDNRHKKKKVDFTPQKSDRKSLGLSGWPTWTDIGLSAVGWGAYFLIWLGASRFFSQFPWFNVLERQDTGFSQFSFGADRIISFVALVIIAPIAEELIFRGWLYGKLRSKTSKEMPSGVSIVISALVTSIAFGAIHGQWNAGIDVIILSLVMCGLREVTGTIYAGILLHMIKNGLAFYATFVLLF